MIEAYKIAVNMTLTGDAHKKMKEFAGLSEKASKNTLALDKSLKMVSRTLAAINKQMDTANPHFIRLTRTMGVFGQEMHGTNRSMNYFNESLRIAEGNTTRLKYETDTLRNSMRSLSSASREARASMGGIRGAHIGGGRGRSGGGGGGGGLSSGLVGAAAGFAGRFIAPAAVAYGAYSFGAESAKASSGYESKISQLVARGYTPDQISKVRQFTNSGGVPGVSSTGMLDAYIDALMATSDPAQAEALAPALARGNFVGGATYGKSSHANQQNLIRFAEYRGKGNPQAIAEALDLGFKMRALSGGTINGNELRAFSKYGGGAVSSITNEAMLGLEPVLQMRGGSSTGTALQTLSLAMIAGQMSTARGRSLTSLGMFDAGAIQHDPMGHTLGNKFGKFKYANQLQTDPFAFLTKTYLPALAKQGIKSPGQIEQRIQYDFSRTASAILIAMYENSAKIQRTMMQASLLKPGTQSYRDTIATQPGSILRFQAAMESLHTAFGKFEEPGVIRGMNFLSSMIEGLAKGLNAFNFEVSKGNNITLGSTGGASVGLSDALFGGGEKKSGGTPIVLNMSGRKVAEGVMPHITGNQNVSNGTTAVNPIFNGLSNGINSLGGSASP